MHRLEGLHHAHQVLLGAGRLRHVRELEGNSDALQSLGQFTGDDVAQAHLRGTDLCADHLIAARNRTSGVLNSLGRERADQLPMLSD